ncbi:hypothetical protein ThidrDRAFT_1827 [Thiorhodococcus drewsii AZ1]|uniref:Glutamate-ammonia-ligase adenylyltransferase n=1 Tax=Thiorhodococcus drewsii AZ1 TaxID=765913 RepID=G2E0K4_9GAMM|nr:hypothetical protein [Thiorhodococcus drewsii]EGV31626.1 hypothetical protein ThidrDRAFT_1827 [Thiorhodococcus drewsii AZ1]
MDRFTRNYSIALGLLIMVALVFWIKSSWQPHTWDLDKILTSDATLASYPYQFRVRSLENGVATISTPRSYDIPAMRFLEIIHPNLAGLAQDDPKMVAAQQDLINHQKRAMGLMLAQPQVKSVDWQLDTQWLADHGVQVPSRTRPGS